MIDELAHHLRQAEVDLGLARSQVGLALCRAQNGDLAVLRVLERNIELIGHTLGEIRRNHGAEDPPPEAAPRFINR